jgi:hypothetical protein
LYDKNKEHARLFYKESIEYQERGGLTFYFQFDDLLEEHLGEEPNSFSDIKYSDWIKTLEKTEE